MPNDSRKFLERLLAVPSPSGFEQPAQRIIRNRMKSIADSVTTDVHGNVTCALNTDGRPRVLIAGHIDQIGLMINYVDDDGYAFFRSIGGVDPSLLPGHPVTIHNRRGTVAGVVGRKPIHLMKQEERGAKITLRDQWIDIGAKNRAAAIKRIEVGDPVTFGSTVSNIGDHAIASPGLDNKIGAYIAMETLRKVKSRRHQSAVFAVSTVQEEIGSRGAVTAAYATKPDVAIVVDVTHATDYPDVDKRVAGDVKLGDGPGLAVGANINPKLLELLRAAAKAKKISVQMEAEPESCPTDADMMQISRAGVATAMVSIPCRYMHTAVEVIDLRDAKAAINLLVEFLCGVKGSQRFEPR